MQESAWRTRDGLVEVRWGVACGRRKEGRKREHKHEQALLRRGEHAGVRRGSTTRGSKGRLNRALLNINKHVGARRCRCM